MSITFCVEHARSARSACKECNKKIGKDELRMGERKSNSSSFFFCEEPFPTKEVCTTCFDCWDSKGIDNKMEGVTKGPEEAKSIEGFEDLDKSDAKLVEDALFGPDTTKDDSSKKEKKEEEKEKKKEEEEEEEEEENKKKAISTRRKRKKPDNGDDSMELREEDIDSLRVDEMKQYCRDFNLKTTGSKSKLAERLRNHIEQTKNEPEKSDSEKEREKATLKQDI
ncbi:hypothetical protein RFI_24679, partial [Reticulomyxa filosa]